jgi:arsenate reductase
MTSSEQPPGRETLQAALDDLCREFAGVFSREAIADCLDDSYQSLQPARILGYLPLLAHRFARERLTAACRAARPDRRRVPLVLFVCTGNSGRSIMAAALLQRAAAGQVEVASAGTAPAEQVQPEVVAALWEAGVGAAEAFPKPLTDEVVTNADVVITMGCGDSCPVIPGRRYLDWDVADPAGASPATVRLIRDDIADRVTVLLAELADRPQHTNADQKDPA